MEPLHVTGLKFQLHFRVHRSNDHPNNIYIQVNSYNTDKVISAKSRKKDWQCLAKYY